MDAILRPFHRSTTSFHILVVGAEGTNKHLFSKTLVAKAPPLKLQIHTTTHLPLPDEGRPGPPQIDFICFVVHTSKKLSLTTVQQSLKFVDVSFFLGKCLILMNTSGGHVDDNDPASDLCQLAAHYSAPVLFRDLEVERERADAAAKILTMLKTATGFTQNVSPLFLDSVGPTGRPGGRAFLFEDD